MANYDIPQYPTKRLRYFNNQFLNDQDFIDDSASQLGHERAFLRSLCVAGVCEGLVVSYPVASKPPSVSAGVAVDKSGCMIVIDQATDGLANPGGLADGDYFVHISFLEAEDNKATSQGAPDYTRWKQTPVINATAKTAALPDGAVVLGSCTVKAGQFVGSGTTIGRQYSGLRIPGPNQNAAATLRNNGAADDLAVLAGSLTIRRDVHAQLGPTLTLSNPTGGAGAGGAIDFNGTDPGTNDPTLRVQSLDDGNYSSHLTFSTKQSGANANKLVERLRLTSDGLLQFSNDSPRDKLVIYDNGATSRYGIGLNAANVNLFYPQGASFSLRQNSSTGTEVFSVSGSGTARFSGPIDSSLTIRRDIAGQLGPTLTLLNGSTGGSGAGGAIDFNGYDPGTNDPTLRIRSLDDGNSSSHLTFSTKPSGANANKLVERLRLTSDGLLQFSNDSPRDKLVIYDNGATNRYGIGLNGSNINLFCPQGAHFSLRQNSSSGTEVFSVSGSGTLQVTDGSRFSGDRHYFTDSEGSNRLRVGTAWGVPGIYSEDNQHIVVGCALGYSVYLGTKGTTNGYVTACDGFMWANSFVTTSDERLKENIEPIASSLDKVVRLHGVSFDWKADDRLEGAPRQLGLIAQHVREVVPEAVVDGKEGSLSIAYNAITALLIEAVKEQQKHIDELRAALTPAPAH